MLPEQDGALRVTGLPLPRISDLAHDADVRLWELSPHQASLEEAYMRMTQGAVDYRSTDRPEGRAPAAAAAGRAAADAGAGPGPAGLVRPAAAPAGRAAAVRGPVPPGQHGRPAGPYGARRGARRSAPAAARTRTRSPPPPAQQAPAAPSRRRRPPP